MNFTLIGLFAPIPALGAYIIAKTLCPPRWKQTRSKMRLAGFISIFVVSFPALFVLLELAAMLAFGR